MNKVGIIIQARVNSTRLPNKVLQTIEKKTILEHVIKKVSKSVLQPKIILAIPNTKENDCLEKIAETQNIYCYRGPEENVLQRIIQAAEKNQVKTIIRICADSPLIEARFIDLALIQHIEQGNDYTTSVGVLPKGFDFEIVELKTLKDVASRTSSKENLEHVTLFVRKYYKEFKTSFLNQGYEFYRKDLKFTVDTEEDFDFLKNIGISLGKKFEDVRIEDVVRTRSVRRITHGF